MGNSMKSCTNCIKDIQGKSDIRVEDNRFINLVNEISNKPKILKRIVLIQSFYRGIKSRKKVKAAMEKAKEKRLMPDSDTDLQFKILNTTNSISEQRLKELFTKLEPLKDHVKVTVQIIEYENESIYYGEWNNFSKQKHGRGINIWACGSVYEGYWRYNKANGYGILFHSDGDKYEGNWIDNKANGYGVYVHSDDGASYMGEWMNDKQHGKGKEVWSDGAVYEGTFLNGLKSGYGVFTWADGCNYKGEFLENNIHGKGQYTWNDKRYYYGDWRHNKMNGKGEFFWPDGRKYVGDYKDDKKDGYGEFEWTDGKKYRGYWSNGRQNGEGEYYNPKEGVWKKGKWNEGTRVQWLA
jgi:hypothetical protein